ncbi:MAG: S41 family peptidase [Firmicutes bacterium]|nr:S41 family peptidase [Bacillota bacterium]MCM1477647.1 S41 family peptidase [Bacteroides sp.]
MKKIQFTLTLAALCAAGSSLAAEAPLWLRDVKISPDGTEIAFTYQGDIYKVNAAGGAAQRLTTLPSYESTPVWSPDGSKIAFASDRNGGKDVYIMDRNGGTPMRLTFNSANETPEGFTPDGEFVLFSAAIQDPATSVLFPSGRLTELYKVPVGGGRTTQVVATPALTPSFLPDGESFLYEDVKGMEDALRKHHTSSVTRDIWLFDAPTGKHTNLTLREGEDRNPVLSQDGQTVYFLSERNAEPMNVYSFDLKTPAAVTKLTSMPTHPVRFLSQGKNGLMAFGYNGEIYTMRPGENPEKVNILINTDRDESPLRLRVSSGSEAAISPDGKQLAFISRGEVFVTDAEYSSTKQVTHTPEGESDLIWGKDSRELYYTSARDGKYNIYKARIARAEDPNFSNATLIDEQAVFTPDSLDRTMPSLSPDGKQLAYILDRNKLMIKDLASGNERQITDGATDPSRSKGFKALWSPDSKWLAITYQNPLHYPYGDIAIIEASTGRMTKVTETGYFDENPRWTSDGNALLFLSERYGMRNHASWGSNYDVMLAFTNQDAYDRYRLSEEDYALLKEVEKSQGKKLANVTVTPGKKDKNKKDKNKKKDNEKTDDAAATKATPVQMDLEGFEDRTVRLTPNSSSISDAIITKDGETLYYLSEFEDGYDLWKLNLRKREPKLVSKLGSSPMGMEMDGDGNIYLIGSRGVKKLTPSSDKIKNISINATFDMDPAAERDYMLRYVFNEERERFYTPDMNGVAWDSLYTNYRRFLPHINNNQDFALMLSELLGELNVSHTGGRYRAPGADEPTASLGLLYDVTYTGPGLKVAEVVKGGPFDKGASNMTAGAIITKINGKELTSDTDPLALLNDSRGKKTLINFTSPSNAQLEEVVLPISAGAMSDLLYRRWVRQREHDVDSLSNGRLGYVHIESMDDESFRKIYAKLLGKFIDREGVVIDTRWNGGGRLHEDIEVLFSGNAYITQDVHGVPTTDMPSRRWNKPSIMLICEANYSNAHGTPWVYRRQGLGKLVGMPVPGTMTSVNWVTMQDPSLVFGIPVVGMRTPEGYYLENHQLEPDFKVANNPADAINGIDAQLRTAVQELLKEIDSKKQK